MTDVSKTSYIKKENLYIFDLNPKIINSLRTYTSKIGGLETPQYVAKEEVQFNPTKPKSSITFCSTCNIEIDGRDHFKTDFHNNNLKLSLKGENTINETKGDGDAAYDSDASISGSDDDSEDELDTIMEDEDELNIKTNQTPFILFESDELKDSNEDKLFAGYKCLFNNDLNPAMQLKTSIPNSIDGKSAIFMIGGGHFAGCIVSHNRMKNQTFNKKSTLSLNAQQVNLLKQKTFHRYTTRRKQGGSQSANDSSGSVAHSAGASIRRYNEMALEQEIKELIQLWEEDLKHCEYIFIKANVKNRKIMVNSESCLKPKDQRLMTLPFNTRRPTSSELKRSWAELTYLKIIDDPKNELKMLEEKEKKMREIELLKKSKVQSSSPVPAVTHELTPEEIQSEEIVTLLKKSKIPALVTFIKKNKIDVNQPLLPEEKYQGLTMLHYASQNGHKQMVYALLTTLKCDPSIQTKYAKTPWQLSKDDVIRHQFQLARHKLGEEGIDWENANVDKPLSKEEIQEIESTAEKQDQEIVEEVMQRELDKLRLQKQEERKNDKKIGGDSEGQSMEGMTEDQKRAYMREVRARAAEARMKR